jgi:hypothetical protein
MYGSLFKNNHRKKDIYFTRDRKLTLPKIVIIMISKSAKSLQNVLNEVQSKLSHFSDELETITASAYTQARDKLNFTAFIELSDVVCKLFYEDDEYLTFKGFRLLAVDGSIVILPNSEDVKKEFAPTTAKNQIEGLAKEVVQARASVLYDVLNYMAVDATIVDKSIDERALAVEHLKMSTTDDLIIFDRGYPSYQLFTDIVHKNHCNYLMRIRTNSFKQVRELFNKQCSKKDITLTINAPKQLRKELENEKLPIHMEIRFVRVVLNNGEIEVLATSVLDHEILQTDDFKELYHQRWGIETYYDILKNRLSLENFTGLSALAVKQDFYATIFISNYESVLVSEANEQLEEKTEMNNNKYPQKVNKSISFNTIKNNCFELLYSDKDIETTLNQMEKLFLTNPVTIRKGRSSPRNNRLKDKTVMTKRALQFQKRKKKSVF